MNIKPLLEFANFTELTVCVVVLLIMARRSTLRLFWPLASYIALQIVTQLIDIPVLFFRKDLGLSKLVAYNIVFYSNWPCLVLEAVLMVMIVYRVYSLILAPFAPLRQLGTIIFRWISAISITVSLGVAIGPHMFGKSYAINVVSQIQQAGSVLTLCLLLFVCFGLRPLGLTFRSRYFGTSLGLGVIAAVQLLQAAWVPSQVSQSMYSPIYLWSALGACVGFVIWGVYFVLPEPKAKMILLPTTSPYFLWNKISEVLGNAPGNVAISGFTPQSLAPAELAALKATSNRPEDMKPRILNTAAYGS